MGAIYYVLFSFLIVLVIAFSAWIAFGQKRMDKIVVLGIDIGMVVLCMVVLIFCILLRNKYRFQELDPDYIPESTVTVSGGDISGGDSNPGETDAIEDVVSPGLDASETDSAAGNEDENTTAGSGESAVTGGENESVESSELTVIGSGTETVENGGTTVIGDETENSSDSNSTAAE